VPAGKRSTLADVAVAAGVSKTTASLALNGKAQGSIPGPTRDRVLAAAGALSFRPDAAARALVRRSAEVLGVVCSFDPFVDLSHHAFDQGLLAAVFHRTLRRGYNPMMYTFPPDGADERELLRYADGRSDAFVLLYPPLDSPLLHHLHKLGMPTVTLCCRDPEPKARWVDSDNEAGIRLAIKHLTDLGHRRIAYLYTKTNVGNRDARVAAFKAATTESGSGIEKSWVCQHEWSVDGSAAIMKDLMSHTDPPTAILVWNDVAAEVVYLAARRLDLRIPEDLSVVGFDDTPSARMADPSLTTIRQDLALMGEAAADLALDALLDEGERSNNWNVVCPVELIVRQSTGPANIGRHISVPVQGNMLSRV
jgi:DNA-binding LacI/PurR family transcriptional regulator